MKKLFTMIALASISYATAQITTNAGTFNKPTAGDTAFEMKFMPNLDGTAMFAALRFGTFLLRSFIFDPTAPRLSVNLEIVDTGVDGMDTAFAVGLGYGIENHFSGAERLSTYWGYQGSIGFADAYWYSV